MVGESVGGGSSVTLLTIFYDYSRKSIPVTRSDRARLMEFPCTTSSLLTTVKVRACRALLEKMLSGERRRETRSEHGLITLEGRMASDTKSSNYLEQVE